MKSNIMSDLKLNSAVSSSQFIPNTVDSCYRKFQGTGSFGLKKKLVV